MSGTQRRIGRRQISRRQIGFALVATLVLLLTSGGATRGQSSAAAPAGGPALTISGDVANPLTLSLDALKSMPRKTVHVNNEHAQEDEVYEGVPLARS